MFGFTNIFTKTPETIAAVDLDSNSFHMIVARVADGQLQIIDRLREMVRLGAGLDDDCQISVEAQDRALAPAWRALVSACEPCRQALCGQPEPILCAWQMIPGHLSERGKGSSGIR